MAGQARSWAPVGAAKVRSNQAAVAGWNKDSGDMSLMILRQETWMPDAPPLLLTKAVRSLSRALPKTWDGCLLPALVCVAPQGGDVLQASVGAVCVAEQLFDVDDPVR